MLTVQNLTTFVAHSVAENNGEGYFRAPLLAVSDAADPRYAELKSLIGPHHLLPGDMLQGARTVVSFFIPFTRAVVDSNRRDPLVSETWARTYVACNKLINRTSQGLMALLERHGHAAGTVAATHTYDPKTLLATWSHKSAACIAGLGEFGRNHLIITEKGAAGRFGTVFTDLALCEGTAVSRQRCLYHLGKGCDFCVKNCPKDAFGGGTLDKWACHGQLKETNARFEHLETCDSCGKCAMGPCAYAE